MKILSWNILADIFASYKYYTYIDKSYLEVKNRYKLIIKWLKKINADVVGLQEITEPEMAIIKKKIGHIYYVVVGYHNKAHWRTKENISNGNAFLVKKTFGSVSNAINVKLSMNGNRALIVNVNNVIYSCLHLDADDTTLRLQQMTALLGYLHSEKHIENASKYVILGDTNEPNNSIEKLVKEYNYTFNKTLPTNYEEYPMVIDYVFIKGFKSIKTKVKKTDKESILKDYGSDHTPVISYIE